MATKTNAGTQHPDYKKHVKDWQKVRDSVAGESIIKEKGETYLPRPSGMKDVYAEAYDPYKDRAHFPLIASYALQGSLGVIITKLPDFNVPPELEYIKSNATKDGLPIQQLFLDTVIEVLQTGRVPLIIDIDPDKNQFKFVRYTAEDFVNWKTEVRDSQKNLTLAVFNEQIEENKEDVFSHQTEDVYRVLTLDDKGLFNVKMYTATEEMEDFHVTPLFMGKTIDEIPVFIAGSLNNSYDLQPIPLLAVANCSIQIYRKEADLSNAEFLSCNPTLCCTGVATDEEVPNVVGSSVLLSFSDPQARVFYTTTDVAALNHVKDHIKDLYEEAIRHGVSLLESRKGVEAAESLRIRQSIQSSTIYSIYLSVVNAIYEALKLMCKWGGYDVTKVTVDKPVSLTADIPDSSLIKNLIDGYIAKVVPLQVVHRYLVGTGLIDQSISYEEYEAQLAQIPDNKQPPAKKDAGKTPTETDQEEGSTDDNLNAEPVVGQQTEVTTKVVNK